MFLAETLKWLMIFILIHTAPSGWAYRSSTDAARETLRQFFGSCFFGARAGWLARKRANA
jgi:hypothetical protein